MKSEQESCQCWCIIPTTGEAAQDPHGHEGEEDRVGTRTLCMTDIFLEMLGADRVIRGKPKDRHKYFSLPFHMKQMQQIRECCTAERV